MHHRKPATLLPVFFQSDTVTTRSENKAQCLPPHVGDDAFLTERFKTFQVGLGDFSPVWQSRYPLRNSCFAKKKSGPSRAWLPYNKDSEFLWPILPEIKFYPELNGPCFLGPKYPALPNHNGLPRCFGEELERNCSDGDGQIMSD